jgi:sRNA-binding protein
MGMNLKKVGVLTSFVLAASSAGVCFGDSETSSDPNTEAKAQLEWAKQQLELDKSKAELEKTKADIQAKQLENIKNALSANDLAKLKDTDTLTAPTIKATYYAELGELLRNGFCIKLGDCTSVVVQRPSLQTSLISYRATGAKLLGLWQDARNIVIPFESPTPQTPEIPIRPYSVLGMGALGTVAVVDAVANLALNIAAAAKTKTALGTTALDKADALVLAAAIKEVLAAPKKKVYDPDAYLPIQSDTTAPCQQVTKGTEFAKLNLLQKASCAGEEIEDARQVLTLRLAEEQQKKAAEASKKKKGKEKDTAKPTKPGASANGDTAAADTKQPDRLVEAVKAIDLLNTEYRKLFVTNDAGVMPLSVALQGETLDNVFKDDTACILSFSTASADADEVVTDGTFSSYKLSVRTATSVHWTLSKKDGSLVDAGFKVLSTPWQRQDLDPGKQTPVGAAGQRVGH